MLSSFGIRLTTENLRQRLPLTSLSCRSRHGEAGSSRSISSISAQEDIAFAFGVKGFGNTTVGARPYETAVTGFLSQQTDDARAVLVENKYGHGEAKVLEVLTDAEEVSGEVIVKEEVIDSRLDRCGGFGGAVLQSRTIADLGVEALAGCQSFVFLDEREQVKRHLIVAAPRNV